jgi:hypothetical protein
LIATPTIRTAPRLDAVNREGDGAVLSDDESPAAMAVEPESSRDTGDPGEADSTESGDVLDLGATAPQPPSGSQMEAGALSAIITEFASRTPRRMSRTLFAEEG